MPRGTTFPVKNHVGRCHSVRLVDASWIETSMCWPTPSASAWITAATTACAAYTQALWYAWFASQESGGVSYSPARIGS
jgi:hypothetical protein